MKNIFVLALLLILSNIQAAPCNTIDLEQEKAKLETLTSFDDEQIGQFLDLKYKVKRAQIMSCLDRVLGGQKVDFAPEDRTVVLSILKDLNQTTTSSEMKDSIQFLFSELE